MSPQPARKKATLGSRTSVYTPALTDDQPAPPVEIPPQPVEAASAPQLEESARAPQPGSQPAMSRRTGFATLDRLLARLRANKEELLVVLERPEVPLHTNGSERDLRPQVIKRKISGGTRADLGRDCRDAFLGLLKTCAKLGIRFWDYLGARLGAAGAPTVPGLEMAARYLPAAAGEPHPSRWRPPPGCGPAGCPPPP